MFRILTLLLIIVCVDCQDWCPLVNPNGTYKAIGVYHRYLDLYGKNEFVMYNRAGNEWTFDLIFDGNNYSIAFRNESVKNVKDNGVVNRFGLYRENVKFGVYMDCTIKTNVNKLSINLF